MSKIPLDENQITKSKKDNSYDLKIIELNEEIKKLNIENYLLKEEYKSITMTISNLDQINKSITISESVEFKNSIFNSNK